jgi:signal transduction histidine kinase
MSIEIAERFAPPRGTSSPAGCSMTAYVERNPRATGRSMMIADSRTRTVRSTADDSLYRFQRKACSAIVQSVPFAVLLLDGKLNVALANAAACVLFDRPADRLRGTSARHLFPAPTIRALLSDLTDRRMREVETCVMARGRHSARRTFTITAVPLAQSSFTLLVLDDISDKAILEQQLIDSEKHAAMGQLAAGLLHEIANPIASLGSNLLLVRKALPASVDKTVTEALDASLDQLEQMRQLLGTLSTLRHRPMPHFEVADLHKLLRHCVSFIAEDAEQRGISISVSFAPAPSVCEMDVRLIKQVLLNILKNSMEAMPRGGRIEVRTARRPATDVTPETVMLEIADTGSGIADADLRRVFRPLFSTKQRGLGLGLSFCRQIIEEHGGEIRLTSGGKDRGATAVIALPSRQSGNHDD